ncbi:putative T7SS-secreted protein [Amycolatopsis sp. NBC_01480]|uniref:putative T7SS-secreted protein n=1 Tax=Amycolatopsis sp. NBC_01480 TaxID=2903562 RepID=UPI002E2D82FF|nr:hypothetical protein [Amycolatopsis sp. NBC_01480]
MGLWNFIDEIGDDLEDTVESVGRGVGKAADDVAHFVGDGLDSVGLHSAAEAVDGFGDSVADTFGAQVGEEQLGQTEDPTRLVHGDAGAITESAGHLAKFATAFGNTAEGLAKVDTAHWTGSAADAFRASYHQHPAQWSDAAAACAKAATALTSYAAVVRWAQAQAAEAVKLYKQAKQDSEHARSAYNQQVLAYTAQEGPRPADFRDPGADGAQRAQDLLGQARRRRGEEGDRAKAAVDAATATAPAEPKFTDRLLNDAGDLVDMGMDGVTHFYGGIIKGAFGIAKFARSVSPFDPYNITHPAEYVAGLSGTAAGLLHTVNHPMDLLKGMVGDGWGSDPAEAFGKLIPNIALGAATDGAGTAGAAAERVAVGVGEEAAEGAAVTVGRSAAETAGRDAASAIGDDAAATAGRDLAGPPGGTTASDAAGWGDHGYGAHEDFGPAGDFGPSSHAEPPAPEPQPSHYGTPPEASWDKSELIEKPDIAGRLDGHAPADPGVHHDIGSRLDGPAPDHAAPHHPGDYQDPGHHAGAADHQAFNDKFGPGNERLLQEQLDRAPDVGLGNEEVRALDHYTGMAHQDLNSALRAGDTGALRTMDPEISEAVSGLNKLPAHQGEVYRGIDIAPHDMNAFLDRYSPGASVREPAFTSADMNQAFSGNVEFVIQSTTGKDISWLKDASVGQSEVLFPPGSGFRVLGRDQDAAGNWKIHLKDLGR